MTAPLAIDVRGMAAISCFGSDRRSHVVSIREGRIGLALHGAEDAWGVPTALIEDTDTSDLRGLTLTEQLAKALREDARLSAAELAEAAVFGGTTTGSSVTEEKSMVDSTKPWGGPGRVTARMSLALGSRGPSATFTTACTSTSVALLTAVRLIRQGVIPRAVIFGIDLMMNVAVVGFRQLQLYSKTACRPFDRDRDGLQIGEALAGIVLEGRRGGRPARFEILDGAIEHDPGHIAAGSTDGVAAAHVMTSAMSRSGVLPEQITAIKAHGTGTEWNDLSEVRGLTTAFPKGVPPFASLKGIFGHTLGASSALETVMWLWCLEEGFIPASRGFQNPAPEMLTPLARPQETHGKPGRHLINSFGFGGTSASFVVADRGAA